MIAATYICRFSFHSYCPWWHGLGLAWTLDKSNKKIWFKRFQNTYSNSIWGEWGKEKLIWNPAFISYLLSSSRLLRIRWKNCHRIKYPFRSFEPKFWKLPYLFPVFFSQAQQAHHDGIRGRSFLWLQLYLGLAWTVGCIFFGAVADNRWLQLWSFDT